MCEIKKRPRKQINNEKKNQLDRKFDIINTLHGSLSYLNNRTVQHLSIEENILDRDDVQQYEYFLVVILRRPEMKNTK